MPPQLLPGTAEVVGGRLHRIGGVDVAELAAEFGTPLYVLDRDELVGRMRAYREAFGADVQVAYAAKALCVVAVLQLAAAEGLFLDVASGGELHTALRAGFPMRRVFFHGNNKSVGELARAVEVGVGRVVVDSFTELARLDALGRRRGQPVPVLLRVTPGVEASTHAFIRTGHDDSKFGFTLSAGLAHAAVERCLAAEGVRLAGVHCHVGSQIATAEAFAAAAETMFLLLGDLRDRFGVVLPELNVGGGLAIAYTAEDTVLPVGDYARTVLHAVAAGAARHRMPVPRLTVEPGRSVAGPAGITLYTVGTIKDVPGVRTYASVDGGMSDNLRPALYGAGYTFLPAGPAAGPGRGVRLVTVVGKHCESGDVLGVDVELPAPVREGELLVTASTGAYAHAMASNYNRLPRPAMVLVADGRARLVVRRETLDEVVGRDLPLEDAPLLDSPS